MYTALWILHVFTDFRPSPKRRKAEAAAGLVARGEDAGVDLVELDLVGSRSEVEYLVHIGAIEPGPRLILYFGEVRRRNKEPPAGAAMLGGGSGGGT